MASSEDWVGVLATLLASTFAMSPAGESPYLINGISEALGTGLLAPFSGDQTIPKTYLQFLYFDEFFNFEFAGFRQVSSAALGAFEQLTLDLYAPKNGYVLIYLANQTAENINVFFDDMRITHHEGPIIRTDDY